MTRAEIAYNQHYTWHESFRAFHTASNEKLRIADAVIPIIGAEDWSERPFTWIDIGCGDCEQIVSMSEPFPSLCEVQLFDPNWLSILPYSLDSIAEFLRRGISVELTPLEFASEVRSACGEASVITVIHSIFDDDIHGAVRQIRSHFLSEPKLRLAIMVAEHADSFIAAARAILRQEGIPVPRALTADDLKPLSAPEFAIRSATIEGQYLHIGAAAGGEAGWLAPFICGDTREQFMSRDPTEAGRIRDVLGALIGRAGGENVAIPDNLWVISRAVDGRGDVGRTP